MTTYIRPVLITLLAWASAFMLLSGSYAQRLPARIGDSPAVPSWDPACYSTYEQLVTRMQSVVQAHPQLASILDAGPSWEGTRRQWFLRITNSNTPLPKPAIFLVGAHRGRDIATPEMLMRLAAYLTSGFNTDPEVTWLLDHRILYTIPLANPDGYYQAYTNRPTWLKNTDNADGCTDPRYWGTDLTRNYPFQWNTGGSSPNPCDSSYPGHAALSEAESHNIANLLPSLQPGLTMSLQAPGDAISYPWGWTSAAAPDAPGLDTLAWSLARLNGTSRAAVHALNNGTPYSGTLDDTAYGQYGIPALTLSIGPSAGPICSELDSMWNAERPALILAAKHAGTGIAQTLSRPYGPYAGTLSVARASPADLQVSAVISANYGTVAGAIYQIDGPGSDGAGSAMSGAFGGGTANVSAVIPANSLPDGRHLLSVQGTNSAGQWGVFSSLFFTVTGSLFTPGPTAQATSTSIFTDTPVPTQPPPNTPTWTQTSTRTPTTVLSPTYTLTPSRTRTVSPTPTPRPPNTATPLPCITFSDVHPSQYFYEAVDWLFCRGIVSGYPDNTFRPWNTATRAQIVKMVVLGAGWTLYTPPTPTFSDAQPGDWFYEPVETAYLHGIVGGYPDGTFRPYAAVTRGQLAKIIALAKGWALLDPPVPHFSDVARGTAFYTYIETAYSHAVVSGYGDGTYRPNEPALRGQLSKMLYVALTQQLEP